ncbi:MAG: ATP-dependent RecD-like DNA helicase [Desulfobacterales bacterium]
MPVEIVGQIDHITYTSEETGFTIARVKIEGRGEPVSVVGTLLAPTVGEVLRMTGAWVRHPKYGEQFRVERYQSSVPVTADGIRIYLGSGMVKGLGPAMAQRIVEKFGRETLEIIGGAIDRLAEVEGIGPKRIALIKAAWNDQKEIRDVMIFLQSHGVSSGHATKIFKQYGGRSIAVVKQNPYRLANEIFGIGFRTADHIAQQLGFAPDSELRVAAGILHVLDLLAGDGHVYAPLENLVSECRKVLAIDGGGVLEALDQLAGARRVVVEEIQKNEGSTARKETAVYLTHLFVCETGVAERFKALHAAPKSLRAVRGEEALKWVQQRLAIVLAENQVAAVRAALTQKVLVITGGPGTGKTTIITAVLRIFVRMGARVLLAAPTGRAAKRMSEACGHAARTIHRLLEYSLAKGGFQRDEKDPLTCDLLVIDEASMIDTVLMYHLLKAVPQGATFILVGDVNQLPSVGAGNVLKDIIDSGITAVAELSEIFRQARHSRIVVNAHRINSGLLPERMTAPAAGAAPSDFYFIQQEDPDKIADIILELVRDRIPRRFGLDPFDDIQVLTPMHRGVIGTDALNRRLQEALNSGRDLIRRGDREVRLHDKVMQIKNNYDKDVFNGDIGRVSRIDPIGGELVIRFEDQAVTYAFSDLDEIVLAYAISVHKSQGSEYPAVIIPVATQHFMLLQRNLMYTAITRGRRLVVMVGTRKALAIAVKNSEPRQRCTRLKERLAGADSSRGPAINPAIK